MFGEDISESPRMPSPWQHISSSMPFESCLMTQRLSQNTFSKSQESTSASQALENFKSEAFNPIGLIPEVDSHGHIEYKYRLAATRPERMAKLVTQLKFRLINGKLPILYRFLSPLYHVSISGGGLALYEIGVLDDGRCIGLPADELITSLETLEQMAAELDASIEVLREIEINTCNVFPVDLSGRSVPPLTGSQSSLLSPSLKLSPISMLGTDMELLATAEDVNSRELAPSLTNAPFSLFAKTISISSDRKQATEGNAHVHDRSHPMPHVSESVFESADMLTKDQPDVLPLRRRTPLPISLAQSLPSIPRYCVEVRVTKLAHTEDDQYLDFECL